MFISGKKQLCVYGMLLSCIGMYESKAMEQPTSVLEGKREGKQEYFISPFQSLPKEIRNYIISFLVSAKDVKEAVENIKNLGATSKEFYNLINDLQVLDNLIREISTRFSNSPATVAIAFMNPSALSWLKEYIERHPQEKEGITQRLNNDLLKAVEANNKTVAEFLLNAGADSNVKSGSALTLLHEAAFSGNKNIVELLLTHGADVNKVDDEGRTGLYCIFFGVYQEIVELLLAYEANVNTADNYGQVPLHWAASRGSNETVELLLHAGADVNTQDQCAFYTSLHWAALKGHKNIVELLLNAGADVNVQDKDGVTPLHNAVFNKDKDIVGLLYKAGADVYIADNEGYTPRDWATLKKLQKKSRAYTKGFEPLSRPEEL
jgi:ankyrin repeat protein